MAPFDSFLWFHLLFFFSSPDHKRIVNEWHGHVEKRFAATYKNTTNKRKNCGHVTAD